MGGEACGQSIDASMDLYRVLQIHPDAEPEVIEGAYKKLCKKYHPDLNRNSNAEDRMKMLNLAYEILSNPMQKKKYDSEYTRNAKTSPFSLIKAPVQSKNKVLQGTEALHRYFNYLMEGKFPQAYDLITLEDKKKISRPDFYEWQKAVGNLYEIGDCHIRYFRLVSGKCVGMPAFYKAYQFQVALKEKKKSEGGMYTVEFTRFVVEEGLRMNVYLGYQGVKNITQNLRQLNEKKLYPQGRKYQRKELLQIIEKEVARSVRYSRPLALLFFDLANTSDILEQGGEAMIDEIVRDGFLVLRKSIRDTDVLGQWSRTRFLLLLPETRINAARKTADRILSSLKRTESSAPVKPVYCVGLVKCTENSIQETLALASANLIAAIQSDNWSVVF